MATPKAKKQWLYQRLGCSPRGVIVELGGPAPVHIASGVLPTDAEAILLALRAFQRNEGL